MTLDIPGSIRAAVRGRQEQKCLRCGVRGAEMHHRRSRRVRDEHTHCTCNVVYLCGWGNHTGCHGWVHSNPFEARALGLIVARTVPEPAAVPLNGEWSGGWMLLDCIGGFAYVDPPEGMVM